MPGQNCQHQQGHDVGDFDHGVDGGAGGVFVGVAYGITGYLGFVGFGALQMFHAFGIHETIFK
jgi:hypothetical protein